MYREGHAGLPDGNSYNDFADAVRLYIRIRLPGFFVPTDRCQEISSPEPRTTAKNVALNTLLVQPLEEVRSALIPANVFPAERNEAIEPMAANHAVAATGWRRLAVIPCSPGRRRDRPW